MVKPDVPPDLRAVKGNVSLDVAVGLDGHVLKAIPLKGPAALYEISVKAVEQWVYQPTTINGTPVIVLTAVDVKYE
jgi:protein TonB